MFCGDDVFQVDPNDDAGIPILRHGKISFVDLAGNADMGILWSQRELTSF